ncbi:hypothetical protein GCM10011609_80600 [Lentzea pudingi]|uniref:DUF418 domain-containing protein n=2 Tax=Lentzea pudingi TaxID=1789439 RepID=A0ABQ2IR99_9PSEU|nr:hypothetical protein GCM10011609_80600 [Lentzea pudingi]
MLLLIALAHAHMYLSPQATGFRSYALDGSPLDLVVTGVQITLVDGRAMPMFAALFGYGFVQIAARQGNDARRVLRRRSAWLLAFGCAHALLLFFGDILAAYGLLGLVLAGAVRWKDRSLLVFAALWLAVHGAAATLAGLRIAEFGGASGMASATDPVTAMIDRITLWGVLTPFLIIDLAVPFLLGVWAAKRKMLIEPHEHQKALRAIAFIGVGTAVVGGIPLALVDTGLWNGSPEVALHVLHGLSGVAGGLGYAALMGLLAVHLTPGPVITALAACGQRSMTCYLLQSVVFVAVFVPYAGGLGDRLGTAAASGVALLTWLATVVSAEVLRRNNKRGPAETLLRKLAYR